MKHPYTDYVSHCLRFYCRNTSAIPETATLTDRRNWEAAHSAVKSLSEEDQATVLRLYQRGCDRIADAIGDQQNLWDLVRILERRVAEERGLV